MKDSFQFSVISYRRTRRSRRSQRTRRSRNGWHLKKDEKLRKASQARNIINANFANLANYTNCLVLSGRVGRMKLLGKVGKMRVFFCITNCPSGVWVDFGLYCFRCLLYCFRRFLYCIRVLSYCFRGRLSVHSMLRKASMLFEHRIPTWRSTLAAHSVELKVSRIYILA